MKKKVFQWATALALVAVPGGAWAQNPPPKPCPCGQACPCGQGDECPCAQQGCPCNGACHPKPTP